VYSKNVQPEEKRQRIIQNFILNGRKINKGGSA
jgi:hypothetical protein